MEALRIYARSGLGYRSPIYVFAARMLSGYYCLTSGGMPGLRLFGMRSRPGPGTWMDIPGLLHPIFIRPATADIESIIDNVFRKEYGRLPRGFSPATIVDAGAYIGDTSAYFLSRFPTCRLIALEPNVESHHLAEKNLAPYQTRCSLMQCALWNVEGTVYLEGEETGASVFTQGVPVGTTTVPRLFEAFGVDRIDLMKMDIEGAEVTVLEAGVGSWLSRIGVLLLETHGLEIEGRVLPLLKREGFEIHRHRNVWYCFNSRFN